MIVAGVLSATGASCVILTLGEYGLLRLVVAQEAAGEARRNLSKLLPEALPLVERILRASAVAVYRPNELDLRRAMPLADSKDVPIMAAAIGSGAHILVTHNVRDFRDGEGVRVLRPRALVEEARAWLARFGD